MNATASITRSWQEWAQVIPPETRAMAAAAISGSIPAYAFGRTHNSAQIAACIRLAGVIDDFAPPGTAWNGLPVIHGDAVPQGALIINSVLHRHPNTLARIDALAHGRHVIHACDLERAQPRTIAPLDKIAETRSVFTARADAFRDLSARLADTRSQDVFTDIMLFRLTGDAAFMAPYTMREADQYFDVHLALPPAPVFVDGGAYHGENTREFCTRHPDYAAAHIFEPVPAQRDHARHALAGRRGIHIHDCALGDTPGTLKFDANAGTSSRLCENGDLAVRVARLDHEIETRVDFIKYDLEGHETAAIRGASALIAAHHPALALCVYHATADFIDIPAEVLKIRDDYTLILRHYTQGWNETVLYFRPLR